MLPLSFLIIPLLFFIVFPGLPRWGSGKESTCKCRRFRRPGFKSLGWEAPLEKGKANYCISLAWRIPWTELGGLRSMGLQRVGCDLAAEHNNIVLPHSHVFENYVFSLLLTSNKLNGNSVYGFISVFFEQFTICNSHSYSFYSISLAIFTPLYKFHNVFCSITPF